MKVIRPSLHILTCSARLWLVLALVGGMFAVPRPVVALDESAGPAARAGFGLLTYTAGDHVLGFQAGGLYIASGDHVLKVEFLDSAAVAPTSQAAAALDGQAAVLGWVSYTNLWPGVSLTYEAMSGGIAKSTYLIDSGARVEEIRLRYNRPVRLDEGGNLAIAFDTGQMLEEAPVAWQEVEGARVAVAVAFRLLGERELGFSAGPYDPRYPILIDPNLTWHTFLGNSATDHGHGIAMDGSGNIYITGYSLATWGSPVRAYTEFYEAFVAKLDGNGSLIWNTFLGGSGGDVSYGIAVDGSGNVYVTGDSTATWGTPVRAFSMGWSAFAAKVDSSGGLEQFSISFG